MALTLETGALVPNANAYVAIADCDAYHVDRGNDAWGTASDAQKTAAIINATAYLDGKYRARWRGWRVSLSQSLEWPRYNVDIPGGGPAGFAGLSNWVPSDSIPRLLQDAVCELALRALSGPLAADITPADRVARKKIDVLDTEYTARDFTTCYQVVDQLVSRFLRNPSEAVRG